MATRIDESREEMLECFRKCLIEADWKQVKDWTLDMLEKAYFDIGRGINKTLTELGFKLLHFGFCTKDEIINDPNVAAFNADNLTTAVFSVAYDYNGADPVTIYMPFSRVLVTKNLSEKEISDAKGMIVFGLVHGFIGHYSKSHSPDKTEATARELLAKLNIHDDKIVQKVLSRVK
jgi:hypothetical protein